MKVKVKCPDMDWCIAEKKHCRLLSKDICQDGIIEAELVVDKICENCANNDMVNGGGCVPSSPCQRITKTSGDYDFWQPKTSL